MTFMKQLILAIFFIQSAIYSFAQQNHFLYIQSDTKAAFTVDINGKTYQATDIGYLIIPKLTNNDYILQVHMPGTPGNISFSCKVENNDQGFLLKNRGEKGWALLNLQTGNIITAGTTMAVDNNKSAFTDMLSDVVHDSTLAIPVVDTPTAKIIEDSAKQVETTPIAEQPVMQNPLSVIASVSNGANTISKMAETNDQTGLHYIFLDFDGQKTDTIYATIPIDQKQQEPVENTSKTEIVNIPVDQANSPVQDDLKKNEQGNGNPFYNIKEEENKQEEMQPPTGDSNVSENTNLGPQRNTCNNQFPEDDMDRLRKKMVSQSTDDKMIAAAIKFIGDRCVTTDQVKTLSGLFLNDASRFNLLSALYPNVIDYANYKSLEGMLFDAYYKKRFEALISQ